MSDTDELTWDELAIIYDAHNGGRRARTLPMEHVVKWAVRRTDLLRVLDNGSFVRVNVAESAVGATAGQTMKSEAHVIQCNDSVEFVVIGAIEQAEVKLNVLREAHYERNRWNYRGRQDYHAQCNWAVRTVPCEEKT